MKKSTMAVIAILATLAIAIGVLFMLSHSDLTARQGLRADAVFLLVHGDVEHRVSVEDIQALGLHEITVNYRSGGRPAQQRVFDALPFAEVLDMLAIDTAEVSSAVFSAVDGFAQVFTVDELLEDVMLVLCEDSGPFRVILPNDPFSQRWVRYLTNVELR